MNIVTMKKNISLYGILSAVLFSMAMVGCEKDNPLSNTVKLGLSTEEYTPLEGNQEKTYINNNKYTSWVNGDRIMVNGDAATITVSGRDVSLSEVSESSQYFSVYPASAVNGTVNSSTGAASITLPAVQTYRTTSSGAQALDAPMAAKAFLVNNQYVLFFKNLCTLLKIHVTSNVTVYNINVRSSSTNLSGTANVTFSDGIPTMGTVSGEKYVSLYCGSGVSTGSSGKDFYVYVPSIASGNDLTISVVAKWNNNFRGVYVKSNSVTTAIPSNIIVPITNAFNSLGTTHVAQAITAAQGNRYSSDYSARRAYINTKVIQNNTMTMKMLLNTTGSYAATHDMFLYGVNNSGSEGVYYYFYKKPSGGSTDLVVTGTNRKTPTSFDYNSSDRISIVHSPSSITINGNPISNTLSGNMGAKEVYLFGANQDANYRRFNGQFHYFRIEDATGLRFYGVPVRLKGDKWSTLAAKGMTQGVGHINNTFVTCMYDFVTGKFFASEDSYTGLKPITDAGTESPYGTDQSTVYWYE